MPKSCNTSNCFNLKRRNVTEKNLVENIFQLSTLRSCRILSTKKWKLVIVDVKHDNILGKDSKVLSLPIVPRVWLRKNEAFFFTEKVAEFLHFGENYNRKSDLGKPGLVQTVVSKPPWKGLVELLLWPFSNVKKKRQPWEGLVELLLWPFSNV